MKQTLTILLADDHPFFTEGVSNALRDSRNYEIIATAGSGPEVMESMERKPADILLLDVNMPGINGLDLSKAIRKKWPDVKIILLTMYSPADLGISPETDVFDGFVLKNSGTGILLEALEQVGQGHRYMDPGAGSLNPHAEDPFSKSLKLSTREKEILQLLIAGLSNKEIASRLFLSELTIKTHRKNIMSKLGAHNLAELLRKTPGF